jgi:DNA-binding Lrp family transcriptional regulator
MKEVELKLISELMKNSRRSDRDLAKTMKISQPTVTRLRTKLEKERYIKEYTIIPDFTKLGYHLMAITFATIKVSYATQIEEIGKTARKVFQESAPLEIICSARGMGLGYQGIFISLHKDYESYLKFRDWLIVLSAKAYNFMDVSTIEGFLISLDDNVHYRNLTFSTLAQHLLTSKEKKE